MRKMGRKMGQKISQWLQRFGRVRWVSFFAIALCATLLFQACAGTSGQSTSSQSPTAQSTTAQSTAAQSTAAPATKGSSGGSANEPARNLDALSQEHNGDTPTPTPIAMAEPAIPVTAQDVTYATIEGKPIIGYLARPESASSPGSGQSASALPALIAIHEWWGLNDNIKAMARRLAGEGYTVLAVDLYNGQTATTPDQAQDLMRSVMDTPSPAQDNISQAAQFLTDEYSAPKLGSIGWCFGGNWSLRTGLLLRGLDAMAIYYGQLLLAPEALDGIEAPVIGFFGEADSSIPLEDVNNFETTLKDLGKTVEINRYPGVGHAFANPSGQNYNAAAAEDAWQKTTAFFAQYLKAS
jgi:carboxymethylenebutenolidase